MKECNAPEKETTKMTRDGAISVNMVTGEVSRTSDRPQEADYSPAEDSGAFVKNTAQRLDDRHIQKSEKKQRKKRRNSYRDGNAVNDRPSSRLQFTEEELAAPELQKSIRKSNQAAGKLDAAKAAIPKKRTLGTERVFDEERGTGHTKLVFKETDKPATIREHTNPLSRPLREVAYLASEKL